MKIIGIDADIYNSGLAIYEKETKKLEYKAIKFFDLHRWFIENKGDIDIVKVEAGFLNKPGNFRDTKNQRVSNEISRRVGINHAVSLLIIQMLEDLQIPYKLSKPLLKKWKGSNGKITHDEIVKLLKPLGITMGTKSNSDQRDAILICLF